MKKYFPRINKQSGVTMIEYALIAAIISVALVAVLVLAKDQLSATFTSIVTALTSANGG